MGSRKTIGRDLGSFSTVEKLNPAKTASPQSGRGARHPKGEAFAPTNIISAGYARAIEARERREALLEMLTK